MSLDPTLPQEDWAKEAARAKSLQRDRPPLIIPGYEPERLLGTGAYGEVWVFVQKSTGRRVAVKFYAHRGGLDWALLAREVEKLAFLFNDRHVVQLLAVGWDADPPYYVMEYMPHGSLADRLAEGPLPPAEVVRLLRDIAQGLVHAHNKGVLHCDLKPANVLLDHDGRARIADFGQSRLSHEQSPALGTLFYMAPEQADLAGVPDARWDVYALGALAYCMLTGEPPRRLPQLIPRLEQARTLEERLAIYRRAMHAAPRPTAHRRIRGVDRYLAAIIDRCLEVDPEKRFPNVQAVVAALDAREVALARRPLIALGVLAPLLLFGVVGVLAAVGGRRLLEGSRKALIEAALRNNAFAAEFVARTASNELERRFEAVESVANSPEFRAWLDCFRRSEELQNILEELDRSPASSRASEPSGLSARGEGDRQADLRQKFRHHPARKALQAEFEALIPDRFHPFKSPSPGEVASWFFCDWRGFSVVRVPESETVGHNYAWRSFFHGGPADLPRGTRPPTGEHLRRTQLSAVFQSEAHDQWIVAVATPVFEDPRKQQGFLGVVALTVRVGRFVEVESGQARFSAFQMAVLVDERPGDHQGVIVQHPLFQKLENLAEIDFGRYRLPLELLPNTIEKGIGFRDPLGELAERTGHPLPAKWWLAQAAPVQVRGEPVGWWVVVQEAYDNFEGTIGWTLSQLQRGLIVYAGAALAAVLLIFGGVWLLVLWLLRGNGAWSRRRGEGFSGAPSTASASEADLPTQTFAQPSAG
ncbi:MAG: protein kinase [Thermoguttaceae bacterium]|nr:protein kinase [Thermoguttaceae bacterium]MDW8079752.1 protein kinase [Thermoguttaceae bacterium]